MEQGATSSLEVGGTPDTAGSTQITYASPISGPSTLIQKLPNELLGMVFESGTGFTVLEPGLPFIVVVSHVCRRWRDVAHSTPDAWCSVPMHPRHGAMTELFLDRSAGRLLDVYLLLKGAPSSASIEEMMRLVAPSAPRWKYLFIWADDRSHISRVHAHLKKMDMAYMDRRSAEAAVAQ